MILMILEIALILEDLSLIRFTRICSEIFITMMKTISKVEIQGGFCLPFLITGGEDFLTCGKVSYVW